MEHLPLFKNNKERVYLFLFLLLLFTFNLWLNYMHYEKFKENEIYHTQGQILNIYPKKSYNVTKIITNNFTFFTSINKNITCKRLQKIDIYIVTKNITFYQYLKGFYTHSFNISIIETSNSKAKLTQFVTNQHTNSSIASLYNGLFLAIPVDTVIREVCTNFGISHLVAISGFHLGVISVVLYFILHILYKDIHQKYFPYRNKRFDIMIIITILLFSYLLFTGVVPSLLRAFVMFLFGLFLLRNNIQLVSFETLLIVVLFIIALFPKLLFSLSLWFSVAGVFYIFLFLHYFKNLNKSIQFILFNFWIYLAINPIVHYFFTTTTIEQLLSPIFTLLFTIFYPLSVLLHIVQMGGLFDEVLLKIMNYSVSSVAIATPLWFFLLYLAMSLLSIISKKIFIVLNTLLISFSIYLFI